MKLDEMKVRWQEQDRKLDAAIRMNQHLLRGVVLGKAETALRRLLRLLWFELLLMQMMLRDLYDDNPTGAHMHYALTEVADECRHSTMFGKSIAHFGVPAYGPPRRIHRLDEIIVNRPAGFELYRRLSRHQQDFERGVTTAGGFGQIGAGSIRKVKVHDH